MVRLAVDLHEPSLFFFFPSCSEIMWNSRINLSMMRTSSLACGSECGGGGGDGGGYGQCEADDGAGASSAHNVGRARTKHHMLIMGRNPT